MKYELYGVKREISVGGKKRPKRLPLDIISLKRSSIYIMKPNKFSGETIFIEDIPDLQELQLISIPL